MKAIKITLLVLVILANLAFLGWLKRENARIQECEDDEVDEFFLRKVVRWKYAIFALDVVCAVVSVVSILLGI